VKAPRLPGPVLTLMFGLHDKVFWYVNGSSSLGVPQLESFTDLILKHINSNRKIMVAMKFDTTIIQTNSPLFSWLPAQSMVNNTGLINSDLLSAVGGWPDLKITGLVSGAKPFYVKAGGRTMYRGIMIPSGSGTWTDSTTFIASLPNSSGQTQVVHAALDLHRFNSNGNLPAFFTALIQEWNW
jgi:hypothetical protein